MTDENQWRTPGFRQSVVQKINEAIIASGSNSSRNANEMENHVFQKARNKDEYLSFIARLILHVREMNSKNKNSQGPGDVSNGNGANGMPDPINALQNMASPGTRNPQMMGPQNNGGNMGVGGNITASNILQTLTQQRPGQQQQQMQTMQNIQNNRGGPMIGQIPNMAGNMQQNGNMSAGNMGNTINSGMAMNGNMNMGMNQMQNQNGQMGNIMPAQMGQMGGNQMQQLQQSAVMNPNGQMGMVGNMPIGNSGMNGQGQMVNQINMNASQINQNQMNQMAAGVVNNGGMNVSGLGQLGQMNSNQMNQINNGNNSVNGMVVQQPQQINPQTVSGMVQQNQMPVNGQINPNQMMNVQGIGGGRKPPEMMMTNSNVFQGVRSVTPNQFLRQSPSPSVPSPAGMSQAYQGQMVPSPALVPSPSPQMPNMMGQRSVASVMAPSPSSSLNTPGQAAVPSPLNPQEEQLYREKYRHLTKYIEPLKRMIARMGNDDVEKLLKMNKLLEILCNPTKRIPLETLLKCEKALEKMDFKSNVSVTGSGSQLLIKEHQINNPLLEAVNATLQSPLGNHTLQRTFRPCLEALFGPDIKNLPSAEKRPRLSVDDSVVSSNGQHIIPHTMQGEIARLDQKFKVSLDSSAQTGTKTIKLVCCLDDKHLPCVPPVTVSIPEDYPATAPNCNLIEQEYSASPFLASVQRALTSRISKLPRQYSLSHLLDTWEMSVRQACAPSNSTIKSTESTILLGI